ncbi:TPA: LysE family translocator [Photobacterium damselae]
MDYHVTSIMLFALSSSITPGPNNIMIMTSGLNFGIRKSLPLLLGISVGFAILTLLVGIGFGEIFNRYPQVIYMIKIIGTTYLLYLAYLIAKSKKIDRQQIKNFGFIKGVLFQWVNAKAWIVTIGAISAFTNTEDSYLIQILTITSIFFLLSIPCSITWLFFGSIFQKYTRNATYLRIFNLSMSVLLLISTIPVIKDILLQW